VDNTVAEKTPIAVTTILSIKHLFYIMVADYSIIGTLRIGYI
jgi:hypothetical protein